MKEIIEHVKHRVLNFVNSDTDECLPYPKTDKDGYGIIQNRINGSNLHIRAHRLVYQIVNSCILSRSELVLHKCDNPPCCNPRHLFLGTDKDNSDDKVSKGRQAKGRGNGQYRTGYESKYDPVERPKTPFDKLHSRSLTIDQVILIKGLIRGRGSKKLKSVSDELGIKYQTVRDISCGKTYQSIAI
jgi:hypothetical protein